MKRLLFAGVISLFIAGCAPSMVKLSDAKQAPKDKIYLDDTNIVGEDVSEVIFIRDFAMMGVMCGLHIYIDGNRVATLDTSEKVSFKIKEGEYFFGATTKGGAGVCSFGPDIQEITVKINPREKRYFRAAVNQDGVSSIKSTSQAE